MNDALHDWVTVIVDERKGSGFIGDGQGELVIVDQTDFLNLRSVVHVVEETSDAKNLSLLGACNLNGTWADLDVDLCVLVWQFESVVEDLQVFVEWECSAG